MLNGMKMNIYAVRGNCEAEVDQMVLEFPVMADYCILAINGLTFYATHGHVYNENNLPPFHEGDILIHGHTHVLKAEQKEGYILLNPGSVSIRKKEIRLHMLFWKTKHLRLKILMEISSRK